METKAWQSRVELFDDVIPIWTAFSRLHKQRFGEMGPKRISLRDMMDWFEIHGITRTDERAHYARCIDAMDDVWWDWRARSKAEEDS